MVLEHSAPREPKSADRIEGAIIAAGAIVRSYGVEDNVKGICYVPPGDAWWGDGQTSVLPET